MRVRSTIVFKVLAVSITCIVVCSKEPPTTPADYMDGNCVGTVKDAAGSPARGASIMLVPEGYSPFSTASGSGENDRIDSTTSDRYGRYGFNVDAPGAYNLLAKGKGLYSMRQSVRVGSEAQVILDDEILREPGSLSGMVHLEGESDHRAAIILLMGTNAYAKPFDSTGTFSFAALAEGLYTLHVLTVENGYAVVETTIAVTSGGATMLPCIELRKKIIPVVDSLSVHYDPAMMLVHLSWPALDTAKIRNYIVYCNRSKNLEPVAIVGKAVTTHSLDIFASPIDTFQYQITAIGNDGTEGPPTAGKLFVTSGATALDTISCAISLNALSQKLCFDRKDNIFVYSGNKIIKLDSKGNFLGEFAFSDGKTLMSKSVRIDTAGYIYALVVDSGTSESLMKFTNDLQLVRELPLDSAYTFTIAVSASGAFMLLATNRYRNDNTIGTHTWTYDTQFNPVGKDSIPETLSIAHSVTCNDTTVCYLSGTQSTRYRIVYFDPAFKEISSPVDLDARNRFQEFSSSVPPGYQPIPFFYLVVKDLFAVVFVATEPSRSLLLFFDDCLQPVARVPLDLNLSISLSPNFDCKGNLYGISNSDKNAILKLSMVKVLGTHQ
jgi:hypothetical protein